ncbi:MAG TPA: hypothetical protein VFE47_02740 [Tepidisphaeraceae bacterium]|jgi:hypothetical protein|nr:hypothetical protein [Tepidisphaeraceae bacterium]
MGFFQRSVNVFVPEESGEKAVVVLRDAIVAALSKKGWQLCDDEDDNVERTMLLASHAGGWLTLLDDEFEQEPDAAERLVKLLKGSVPGPILLAAVDDNQVSDLVLCDRDHTAHLADRDVADGWSIPAKPPWTSLLADKRFAVDPSQIFSRLDAVVDALGLDLNTWMDLGAEYEEDETAAGVFIRLRKKKRQKKPASPRAEGAVSAVVSPAEGAASAAVPTADPDIVLPAFLVGDLRTVRRRWKMVMRTLLKTGSWAQAMQGQEMLSLRTTEFVLFLDAFSMDSGIDNVFRLTVIPETLCEAACDDNYARYDLVRDLMLEGMDQFWMCVTMLGDSGPRFLPHVRDQVEEANNARMILGKFASWWNELCSLEGLYHMGWLPEKWPHWARRLWPLTVEAGIPDELFNRMYNGSGLEAGDLLKSWLGLQTDGQHHQGS